MADPDLELEPEDLPEGDEPDDEPEDTPEDEPEDEPEGDPAGDPEDEPEPDPDPAPPARQSKAQDRIRRQQAELAKERVARQALERQMAELQRSTQTAQQAENQRRQAEMLANMEPAERARFETDQRFQALQQQIQRQSWELQENSDRTAWTARTQTDAVAKRYADRVDARLAEMRANGQTAPRASVYYYLLGEDIAKKGPKAIASARVAASGRARNAAGNPPRARPDASGRQGRVDPDSIEALEARLGKAVF